MSNEILIQTLNELDLDPTAVEAMSRQIREEGMNDDTRARLIALLREASATSRKTDEELLDLFEIVATAETKQERRKAELKLKLKQIEDDTEIDIDRVIGEAKQEEIAVADQPIVDQEALPVAAVVPAPVWD